MCDHDKTVTGNTTSTDTRKNRTRPPPSRRRDKPQLSCDFCRRRKLKCNRENPCNTCSTRGLGLSCTYAANVSRPSNHGQRFPSRHSISVQDRIQHLESLVVSLMQKTATKDSFQEASAASRADSIPASGNITGATTAQHTADDASTPSDYGSMKLSDSGTSYVGSAHWAAVLGGIAELKDLFEGEESREVEESHIAEHASHPFHSDLSGPQLLYGNPQYATKEEILASVPVRPVADRLLSSFFNLFEMSPAILHSGQFLKEYEQFWENPLSAPPVWIGLLFVIMCLAAQFQKFKLSPGPEPSETPFTECGPWTMIEIFRQRIVQCLILGKYVNGGPYVMETLMLYYANEHFFSKDANTGIWVLLGMIVQFAMRMGYHRDPKHFQGITPLAAEMRRRVWASIVQLDLGVAIQMGLPRLIKHWQADTEEPRNLLDRDFDENTTELPQARPDTEITFMLYWITKTRLMSVLGLITDFTADTTPYRYDEVMKMDTKLQEAKESIPAGLRWRSMVHCITDSPQIIMQKMYLDVVFYKAKIILHRKYFIHPGTQRQHGYSREACLDAALKILECQHFLDEEVQPLGQLYQDRWRISSIVNHVFLLATSILCYYFQRNHGKASDTELTKIEASLRRSYDIWLRSSSFSKEAQKATEALSVVLQNNTANRNPNNQPNSPIDLPPLPGLGGSIGYFQDVVPAFNLQASFGSAALENWPFSINDPIESYFGQPTSFGLQSPDAIEMSNSPQWPWNNLQ